MVRIRSAMKEFLVGVARDIRDKERYWWCSYFGNDSQSHFREKVGFVRVDFTSDGRVFVAKEQPFVTLEKKEEWVAKWMEVWKHEYNE